jgi:hypothetical protein
MPTGQSSLLTQTMPFPIVHHPVPTADMPQPHYHTRNTSWPWFPQDDDKDMVDIELGSSTDSQPDNPPTKSTLKSRMRNFKWMRKYGRLLIGLISLIICCVAIGLAVKMYLDTKKDGGGGVVARGFLD